MTYEFAFEASTLNDSVILSGSQFVRLEDGELDHCLQTHYFLSISFLKAAPPTLLPPPLLPDPCFLIS